MIAVVRPPAPAVNARVRAIALKWRPEIVAPPTCNIDIRIRVRPSCWVWFSLAIQGFHSNRNCSQRVLQSQQWHDRWHCHQQVKDTGELLGVLAPRGRYTYVNDAHRPPRELQAHAPFRVCRGMQGWISWQAVVSHAPEFAAMG